VRHAVGEWTKGQALAFNIVSLVAFLLAGFFLAT
jgi:hypothetical protein